MMNCFKVNKDFYSVYLSTYFFLLLSGKGLKKTLTPCKYNTLVYNSQRKTVKNVHFY